MVIWMWGDLNRPHYEEQVKRWNEEKPDQPKLILDYQLLPSTEETIQKGMNAMAAGSGIPDVFPIEISHISKFYKGSPTLAEGNLMDLSPKLDVFDPGWKENYIGFSPYSWMGKVYGFEIGISPTGYYYRRDVFEKLGIKMPLETWEDFMLAGEELAKAGHSMIDVAWGGGGDLTLLFHQAGALIFDDQGQVAFDEERVYTSLQLYVEGVKNKSILATDDTWSPAHFAGLNDGSLAGVLSANWYSEFVLKPNCADTAGKWGIQLTPKWKKNGPWGGPNFDERPTSTLGGTAMTIPKKGPKPDLTFDYMAFSMLTVEGAKSVYKYIQQIPMNKSVIHDESVVNIPDEFYGGQSFNKVFADIAESIPKINIGAYYNEAITEIGNAMVPALKGTDDPEEMINSAAKKVRDLMAIGG